MCPHPASCTQSKRHQFLLTNTLRIVWIQRMNPTVSCFLCRATTPLSLVTFCVYSLHALLICLSFSLKASLLLLSWVDDFCKDSNIWQDILPMLSSASVFFVFSFSEDTSWGFLPILELLLFLHAYPQALFCWAFQSYSFLLSLNPMTLNPVTVMLIYCSSLLH